jgi:hypothetical protein
MQLAALVQQHSPLYEYAPDGAIVRLRAAAVGQPFDVLFGRQPAPEAYTLEAPMALAYDLYLADQIARRLKQKKPARFYLGAAAARFPGRLCLCWYPEGMPVADAAAAIPRLGSVLPPDPWLKKQLGRLGLVDETNGTFCGTLCARCRGPVEPLFFPTYAHCIASDPDAYQPLRTTVRFAREKMDKAAGPAVPAVPVGPPPLPLRLKRARPAEAGAGTLPIDVTYRLPPTDAANAFLQTPPAAVRRRFALGHVADVATWLTTYPGYSDLGVEPTPRARLGYVVMDTVPPAGWTFELLADACGPLMLLVNTACARASTWRVTDAASVECTRALDRTGLALFCLHGRVHCHVDLKQEAPAGSFMAIAIAPLTTASPAQSHGLALLPLLTTASPSPSPSPPQQSPTMNLKRSMDVLRSIENSPRGGTSSPPRSMSAEVQRWVARLQSLPIVRHVQTGAVTFGHCCVYAHDAYDFTRLHIYAEDGSLAALVVPLDREGRAWNANIVVPTSSDTRERAVARVAPRELIEDIYDRWEKLWAASSDRRGRIGGKSILPCLTVHARDYFPDSNKGAS